MKILHDDGTPLLHYNSPMVTFILGLLSVSQLFQWHWQAGELALASSNYSQAVAHFTRIQQIAPFEPSLLVQRARCLAALQQEESAWSDLDSAIRFGWADGQGLEQHKELLPLREQPRWKKLLAEVEACRQETVILHAAPGLDLQRPVPVLLLLHGLGAGPRCDLPYWKEAAERTGYLVVAPKGPTTVGPQLHGWHQRGSKDSTHPLYFDLEQAQQRVDDALKQARTRYNLDDERIVLAGYSQGAGVAVQLATQSPKRYLAVIALNGLYQRLRVADKPMTRFYLLSGERDMLHARSLQLYQTLLQRLADVQLVTLRSDHHYPPSFTTFLLPYLKSP